MTTDPEEYVSLLALVWSRAPGRPGRLTTASGENIYLSCCGYEEPSSPGRGRLFTSASLKLSGSGVLLRGAVRIDVRASDWRRSGDPLEGVILHVVGERDTIVIRDGYQVPTLVMPVPEALTALYRTLTGGEGACEEFFGTLEPVARYHLLSRLLADRLDRKVSEVLDIWHSAGEDWEETAYICLLRTLGMGSRKRAFEHLARSLPLRYVLHCGGDARQIEALFLGQSGYLSRADPDPYTRELQDIYLALKRELNLNRPVVVWRGDFPVRPASLPPATLAHAAALLAREPHLFARLVELCRSGEVTPLRVFFRSDAGRYWQEQQFREQKRSSGRTLSGEGRIGLRIINFVIPLVTAYARTVGDEELRERALGLYDALPPEENTYTRRWSVAAPPESAFDSQAMIQLSTEYCGKRRCGACPLGIGRLVTRLQER